MPNKKPRLSKSEKKALKHKNHLENENKIGINQFIKIGIFLLCSLAIEIATYLLIGLKSPAGNQQVLPTYLFFDIGCWLILCSLMLTCSKNWVTNTFFYAGLVLQMILLMANTTLYVEFGYLFTWDMFKLILEGGESFDDSFINIPFLIICVVIILILIAIPIIIDKLLSKQKITMNKISKPLFYLLSFFICFTFGVTSFGIQANTLPHTDNEEYQAIASDKYLYENMHIKEEAFRKFGTCGFYFKNLYDLTLANFDNSEEESIKEYVNQNIIEENTSATLYGDNLIVFMLESYEWFAIDPYLTPNLWKLKTGEGSNTSVPAQGVVMDGYVSNNKTNMSETISLLGYMPSINSASFGKNDLSVAYSLPNLFKAQGYETNYFHSWKGKFYNRRENLTNLGFDNFYSLEDYNGANKSTTFKQFNKEADFTSAFINKIAPTDKKFMSFYTTVSTHGTYTVTNQRFAEYYQAYDDNKNNIKEWLIANGYNYPTDSYGEQILRHYKCAAMDTDAMVGILFDHLTQNNMLDNTTVMLFSDHNAYYHDLSWTIKGTDPSDNSSLETHGVPMIIYSSKLDSRNISNFCNTYDIYPTICNAFGLEYSSAFALGVDMLSTDIENSMFMSFLTGFYSQTCYSKNASIFKLYDGATDSNLDTFKKLICKFYDKQIKLDKIYYRGWTV